MSDGPSAASGLLPPTSERPTGSRTTPDARLVAGLCPFLASADRDWRSLVATREHRCTAVEPVAALTAEKQRRLCLTPDHESCATYLAARKRLLDDEGSTGEGLGPADDGDERMALERPVLRWALPRTAPVVLDRGRQPVRDLLVRRSTTQLALVLLMALAFLVLALARLSAGGTGAHGGEPGSTSVSFEPSVTAPAVAASAIRGASSAPSASAASGSVPSVSSPARSPTPAASPSAAARTYRVVSGDTLTGIAARFGVTLRALEAANGITDPSRLRVGTVLTIPQG